MILIRTAAQAQTANDYFISGNQKEKAGDHYGAFTDFTKSITIKPEFARAYFNRGISKQSLKIMAELALILKKQKNLVTQKL